MSNADFFSILERRCRAGVSALKIATPEDTGLTAKSWGYEIVVTPARTYIYWTNSNLTGNTSVAILIQYGHMTKNGYWVEGVDYINPVLQPVFLSIAEDIWKEVTK